ncbi:MAG: hypothetical protein WBP56_18530 [Polyangia bacterium]
MTPGTWYRFSGARDAGSRRHTRLMHLGTLCQSRHRLGVLTMLGNSIIFLTSVDIDPMVCIKDWLAAHPRFLFHFTPTHGFWLNQVEQWFQQLSAKVLRRGVFNSTDELHSAIMVFISRWDANPHRFNRGYGAEFLDEQVLHHAA